MDTQELLAYLEENPDEDAYDLLMNADRTIERRFRRACKTLAAIMSDVNKHFPDATYYTASGGLNIILGATHSGRNCHANRDLNALGACGELSIGDGDW